MELVHVNDHRVNEIFYSRCIFFYYIQMHPVMSWQHFRIINNRIPWRLPFKIFLVANLWYISSTNLTSLLLSSEIPYLGSFYTHILSLSTYCCTFFYSFIRVYSVGILFCTCYASTDMRHNIVIYILLLWIEVHPNIFILGKYIMHYSTAVCIPLKIINYWVIILVYWSGQYDSPDVEIVKLYSSVIVSTDRLWFFERFYDEVARDKSVGQKSKHEHWKRPSNRVNNARRSVAKNAMTST